MFVDGFTRDHSVKHLVWYEQYDDMRDAIQREKNLKHWVRQWKLQLVETMNPTWAGFVGTHLPVTRTPPALHLIMGPRVKPEDDAGGIGGQVVPGRRNSPDVVPGRDPGTHSHRPLVAAGGRVPSHCQTSRLMPGGHAIGSRDQVPGRHGDVKPAKN